MTIRRETPATHPEPGKYCDENPSAAMKDLQPHLVPGAPVTARGRPWSVVRVQRHARCRTVALAGARSTISLIVPIDRVAARGRERRWRRARVGHVADTVLRVWLEGTLFARLERGPAPLALLPWQLAAASMFDEGRATRVLLADAVGLGKTIQAGLAACALRSRNDAARVLVLTPASLRDPWAQEWSTRLGLAAWVADPASVRRARAELPAGASPWAAHPIVICSIDYVKQPEVLAAAAATAWDLLVLDEAHNAGPGSDRRVAAHALASAASHVVLVTATPHAGEDGGFAALTAIGARAGDEAPVLIRRGRTDVGLTDPGRLRVVRVRASPAERRMHDALRRYARRVCEERQVGAALAMVCLMKRAASSPLALERSLAHRRARLAGLAAIPVAACLPFDDELDERDDRDQSMPDEVALPGLADRDREIGWLDDLHAQAREAAADWRKGSALARWLRRWREPVILFTEYRDTLDAILLAVKEQAPLSLHGGLSRPARAEALALFLAGRARVLATTDVAGEGLNLQSAARTVISLELPWTPARLEQRAGRVDRIGQTRPVTAACLVGTSAAEREVVARVAGRVRRASAVVGTELEGRHGDLLLLAAALGVNAFVAPARSIRPTPTLERQAPVLPDVEIAARAWTLRRAADRRPRTSESRSMVPGRVPWMRVRPRTRDDVCAGAAVLVFRIVALGQEQRVVADSVVALRVSLAVGARSCPVAVLLRTLAAWLEPAALRAADVDTAIARARSRARAEIERLTRLPAVDPPDEPRLQPSLFDRRAITEAAQRKAVRDAVTARRAERLGALASDLQPHSACTVTPIAAFIGW
jgi:superfamily II DNA or RNA helicase